MWIFLWVVLRSSLVFLGRENHPLCMRLSIKTCKGGLIGVIERTKFTIAIYFKGRNTSTARCLLTRVRSGELLVQILQLTRVCSPLSASCLRKVKKQGSADGVRVGFPLT